MKKSLQSVSKFILIFSFLALSPVLAFAQFVGPCPQGTYNDGTGCVPNSGLVGLLQGIQGLLNAVIPVLIALGVVYLVWGIVQYVIADEEEAKKKGKDRIVFGIIGLAIIISVWGLVYIVVDTFDINNAAPTNANLQNLLPR